MCPAAMNVVVSFIHACGANEVASSNPSEGDHSMLSTFCSADNVMHWPIQMLVSFAKTITGNANEVIKMESFAEQLFSSVIVR